MKYVFVEYHKRVSDDEFCADLIRVAEKLNVQSLSAKQYDENGSYRSDTISRRFGCWTNALIRAGLTPDFSNRTYTTDELFENIERVWVAKGKQPVSFLYFKRCLFKKVWNMECRTACIC